MVLASIVLSPLQLSPPSIIARFTVNSKCKFKDRKKEIPLRKPAGGGERIRLLLFQPGQQRGDSRAGQEQQRKPQLGGGVAGLGGAAVVAALLDRKGNGDLFRLVADSHVGGDGVLLAGGQVVQISGSQRDGLFVAAEGVVVFGQLPLIITLETGSEAMKTRPLALPLVYSDPVAEE